MNRLRISEYRAIFEQYLDTIEWSLRGPEAEHYLTPEIERELARFPRAELLTGKIDYTGQKPIPVNLDLGRVITSVVRAAAAEAPEGEKHARSGTRE